MHEWCATKRIQTVNMLHRNKGKELIVANVNNNIIYFRTGVHSCKYAAILSAIQ